MLMQHGGVMTRCGTLASMTHSCQNLILNDLRLQRCISKNGNIDRDAPTDATGVLPESTAGRQEPRESKNQDGGGGAQVPVWCAGNARN